MDDAAAPGVGNPDGPAIAQTVDAVGADLYRELGGGANTAFSPVSIAIAFHMALHGARGRTAAELARFLHLSDLHLNDPGAAAEGLPLLTASLAEAARTGDATLRLPNAMWVQSGLALQPSFTDWINGIAEADVRAADFLHEAEKARREINRVVAEQTAQKITGLLAPGVIGASTRLVLTNAVYLKADWAQRFPAAATHEAPFHLDAAGTVTVNMMRTTARFGYLRADGYQAVRLPYMGGRLAMTVVLPDGPLAPLEEHFTAQGMRSLTGGLSTTRVDLSMPRFRVTSAFKLSAVLRLLGVSDPFTGDADFSGITSETRLHIDEVVHKAYVDVDENGTEAAAATAVVMRVAALVMPDRPPVTVIVDRPFLFAIADTVTGVPLFLGRVTNPALR
ncbi:MAG: serpin family protein [Micromonosporaceae bacterium]